MTEAIPGAYILGTEEVECSGVEYHSKMVKPGSVFVAIGGYRLDGNDYAEDAVSRGAVAVVTEKEGTYGVPQIIVPDARAALADAAAAYYQYADNTIKLCAVTGTNGKTTSCFLLRNILLARGKRVGLITSLVYDTMKDQIPAVRTTPESLDIHRLLYSMKSNFCNNAVIEVSSHALMLQRIKNLDIQVALFTNFTRDHLDFHQTMEEYLDAKARLLDFVTGETKWAVINYDCPEYRSFIERLHCSHMTYSLEDPGADIYLVNFELRPDGSRFELHTPMGNRVVDLKLPGRFNLYNALAAVGAGLASGADLDAVVVGLEKSRVVPGRLDRVESAAPFSVFVDYAHTPDALARTIETLRELGSGRILTLFGCGGDRDKGKRPLMGQAVTSAADFSVLTSDNPRSEDPEAIIDDVRKGFSNGAAVEVVPDRAEAIARILSQAAAGDIVLLAGKGVENYQEVNGVRHPFVDKDVALAEIHKRGYGN